MRVPGKSSQAQNGPFHLPLAGELQAAGLGCAHLAVLTTESVRCTLCPWPQLAGEVITARISAVLRAGHRGLGISRLGLRASLQPPSQSLSQQEAHSK